MDRVTNLFGRFKGNGNTSSFFNKVLGKNKRPDSSLCSSAHWSDQEDDWETIDTISVGSSDMDDISILSFSPSPKKPGRGVLWMREQFLRRLERNRTEDHFRVPRTPKRKKVYHWIHKQVTLREKKAWKSKRVTSFLERVKMPRQRLPTPTSSSSSLLLSDEEEEKSSPDDEPSYSGSYLYCGCEYCPFYGHHVTPEMQRQIDENNQMPPSLIVDEDEDEDVEYLVEDIVIGPTYDPVGEAINVEVWGGRPWNQQHRNRF